MAKLPNPPASLSLAPAIKPLAAGSVVWRIYKQAGPYPASWNTFRYHGPTPSRFDHHLLNATGKPCQQNRGIVYVTCGRSAAVTALAEAFQSSRVIDRRSGAPWIVAFALARNVRLLDLTSVFPTKAGASMNINSGPRSKARKWSQLFYATYANIDGLYFSSSMYANEPCIALFERADPTAIPAHPLFHRALADATLLGSLHMAAQQIGYTVV